MKASRPIISSSLGFDLYNITEFLFWLVSVICKELQLSIMDLSKILCHAFRVAIFSLSSVLVQLQLETMLNHLVNLLVNEKVFSLFLLFSSFI